MATRLSESLATFNDGSQQDKSTNSYALGVGQTWTNVTSSRALQTVYTNSTGRPIMLAITNYFSQSNALVVRVNSFGEIRDFGSSYNSPGGGPVGSPAFCIVIPIGATYTLFYQFWAFEYWWELR